MAEPKPTLNLTSATPETGTRSSAEGSASTGPTSRREPARLAVTPIHLQTLELHEPASKETVRAIQQLMSDCGSHEVFWDRCGRSDWLLGLLEYAFRHELLDARPLQAPLRRFACWSARAWQPTGTQLDAVLALAKNKDQLVWPPKGKENWSDSFHARCYADANPGVIAAAESIALSRQANVLRFWLPKPFEAGDRRDKDKNKR